MADLEKKIDAVLKTVRTERKPLRREVMESFGGKRAVLDTLEEAHLGHLGLCRLDRDTIGTRKHYYIRMGIDAQGIAKQGGMPVKKLSAARRIWNDMVARNRS